MALPASGAISLGQVNVELGLSATAQISMNDSAVRTLFAVGGSGTSISMSQGYGKANQFAFTIASNQTNANLRTLAINAGWNQSSALVATIASGVYISSNSTGTPALTVSGSFPGGVTLVNNGYIVGMGGAGGQGRAQSGGGYAGLSGGLALSVSSGVTINNQGTIAGGGGGGGGGGYGLVGYAPYQSYGAGGPGGGGRSSAAANSSGGPAAQGDPGSWTGYAGTLSSAGAGREGYSGGQPTDAGAGGAGGGWGASGSSGGTGGLSAGYSGGSGGGAVTGNANISWSATGTRYGAIS